MNLLHVFVQETKKNIRVLTGLVSQGHQSNFKETPWLKVEKLSIKRIMATIDWSSKCISSNLWINSNIFKTKTISSLWRLPGCQHIHLKAGKLRNLNPDFCLSVWIIFQIKQVYQVIHYVTCISFFLSESC